MCGSSPLPEAVTRSTGIGVLLVGIGLRSVCDAVLDGVDQAPDSIGPRFEPLDAPAL